MKEIDCFVVQVFVSSSQNYRSNVSYKLKEMFDSQFDFFLMKKGIHIMNKKKSKESIYHCTTFYSIFNMSSSGKPNIHKIKIA